MRKIELDEMPSMPRILPVGVQGVASVDHFEIGEREAVFTQLRAVFTGGREHPVPIGCYTRLTVEKTLMMTDTPFEWDTNREVRLRAHGEVLIAGLGLGFILPAILGNPRVRAVTVLEKHQDVVNLVEPHLRQALPRRMADKLTVVRMDVHDFSPPPVSLWDAIYFDIWPNISADNLPEMTRLKAKFRRSLRHDGWMGCWSETEIKARKRKGW